MHSEATQSRGSDLRLGGAVSLAVHALLIVVLGVAVTHSRATFTPPSLQAIRLDVDLPAASASETASLAPSASPVQAAVPQDAATPRPAVTAQVDEQRLSPPAASQDLAPAAPDSVDSLASQAGGVTTFVATETAGKSFFGTGAEGILDGIPTGHAAQTGRGGTGGNGVGIEGPISVRRNIKPLYPLGARQRGEEGTVVLEALVAPDGHASSVAIASSSRFAELDRAAAKAVERATFNPATEDGHAVEARARITIIFRLTN